MVLPEHDDRNRIVPPTRSAPDLGSLLYLTSLKLITNKTKTSKVYPKYWPTKTEPFGSTSISLYVNVNVNLIAYSLITIDSCMHLNLYLHAIE